jgi:hypothetical protein
MKSPPEMRGLHETGFQRCSANCLGLKMRSFTPPSSVLHRTLNVFRLLRYGPERPVGEGKLFLDLLCHLPAVARLYGRQRRREQENGGVAADAILVEFTVP